VVMPGRNRAEDQEGDDNETGKVTLRAHVGESSHVPRAACGITAREARPGYRRSPLFSGVFARAAPSKLHSYTATRLHSEAFPVQLCGCVAVRLGSPAYNALGPRKSCEVS
jgi:hypothetical protein